MKLKHFTAAIEALGSTDQERADMLRVSPRMIRYYREGRSFPSVEKMLYFYELFDALGKDSRDIVNGVDEDDILQGN